MTKVVQKLDHPHYIGRNRVTRMFSDNHFKNYRKLVIEKAERTGDKESLNLIAKEWGDCMVYSLAAAADLSYRAAHQFVKNYFNRQDRNGTYTFQYCDKIQNIKAGDKVVDFLGHVDPQATEIFKNRRSYLNGNKHWTLQRFVENHPTGRFILIVKGHAIAVVNGVLMGNWEDQYHKPSQRVQLVFKVQD